MHRKRNNFLWILIFITIHGACKMDKKAPEQETTPSAVLVAFRDGQAVLSDSTTVAIPHWGDTTYTIFYCVRHAEKRKDQGDNPALTAEGEARAGRLGNILKGVRIDQVSTTNYKRTVQTAEIVRGIAGNAPAETYPPANQDIWLENKLNEGSGKHYFIVGHQNTVPRLLNQLKGGTEFGDIPEDDHGRFYIAVTKGIGQTEVLEFRY